MKFGRNLPRNQVPEWASSYINYKGLKKLVKVASQTAERGETADLAEFFFALDRNLEDVDSFYNKKFADTSRRLRLLQDRYGTSPEVVAHLDQDEIEELMGALLELRSQLRNLQWFGEINRRGFVKITKKLDKKVPNTSTQHRYIATKVDPCPFARDTAISRVMSEVNRWLLALGDVNQIDDTRSERSTHSLGRVTTKAMLNLSNALLDKIDQAIRSNDLGSLEAGLREGHVDLSGEDQTSPLTQGLLLNLLQRAISARSRDTIRFLLGHLHSLDEPDDINQRNCIHRLVIHIGRSKSTPPIAHQQEAVSNPTPFQLRHTNHYATQYLTPAASPLPVPRASHTIESQLLEASDPRVQYLVFLLDSLSREQQPALQARDLFGRMPLHYAAQFGFVVVCEAVISRMQAWGQFNVENGIDAPEWQDNEGYAPIHLSVIGGHPLTTKVLLHSEDWKGTNESKSHVRMAKSSAVLAIATKHNHFVIVQTLVDAGVDINWQDETGETALHIAARFGHHRCAKILLAGSNTQKASPDLPEKSFAWTPLHISAVDGHLSVVRLLVETGADVDKVDSSGWTAKEHAALRGHLDIAKLLLESSRLAPGTEAQASLEDATPSPGSKATTPEAVPEAYLSLGDRTSNSASRLASALEPLPPPVRTYGHRYLKDETLVLVSLGSMDMRKNTDAVKLDKVPLAEAHNTQLDTALSIVVSAHGAVGEPTVVDLPVQENISTEPIVFTTKDMSGVKLLFDIVPTYSGNKKNKIGRGVALLSTVRPTIGSKRMNLQGDVCVPIMSADLEIIGTVNFNFLVITPFMHPNMEVNAEHTYWRKVSSAPMVIGHRGMGKNMTSNRSLQLGENTVPSFIAAANLGANYVEFDVQLTKDHIPVIYHDFLVSETGFDAPVHTLTLEQFLHINSGRIRSGSKGDGHTNGHGATNGSRTSGKAAGALASLLSTTPANKSAAAGESDGTTQGGVQLPESINGGVGRGGRSRVGGTYRPPRRAMSMSLSGTADERTVLEERMKHTRDFKEKGFKANSRGNFIQAPFATLEELFNQVPASVGFNIEMKYPMLHESEEHEMDTYAVELNSFCDTVLTKVYELAGSRNLIFSSFNPDICLCLSFKQPNFPIMFLTDAGGEQVCDIRASSLQEAIRFARRWNLLGIVSLATPFVNSPRLVRVVKQSGLVCVSYGTENNDPEMVERQVKEGIDAVIVDSVLAIRKGLTKEDSKVVAASSEKQVTDGVAVSKLTV
ncbi:glycerophosphodiester phosphodiesterase gde1 [Grosmannia clavigera kw1407]|uniref:Glycerophosphodiester phosphodiesterase gde1 n=1 Tax=Grosmannia clavigera (strain kw1407 / UAMH 11150) TaxID=655863 RepID=F0XRS4_GROCL|nr:glycerophosphodiester phosphodiesterase gde1 [Grosmannia clavigera kw1407]EFW99563.1 glycerophosphodiester phosphodiesterase gde1 [Grosmannia clavigera kw1407]